MGRLFNQQKCCNRSMYRLLGHTHTKERPTPDVGELVEKMPLERWTYSEQVVGHSEEGRKGF